VASVNLTESKQRRPSREHQDHLPVGVPFFPQGAKAPCGKNGTGGTGKVEEGKKTTTRRRDRGRFFLEIKTSVPSWNIIDRESDAPPAKVVHRRARSAELYFFRSR